MTTVTIQVPAWLQRSHNLASREMTGTIQRTTQRGILFDGHATLREAVNCLRCGRELDNPYSRACGYGPICSDLLGIPREFEPDQLADITAKLQTDTHITLWLPKSKVTIHGSNGDVPEPEPEPEPTSTVTVDGDTIRLNTVFQLKEIAKSIPGARWNGAKKAWIYPASPSIAKAIVDAYRNHRLDTDPDFDLLLEESRAAAEAQKAKTTAEADLAPIPQTKTRPWEHQLQAYHFGMPLRGVMYAIEMGGGKSKVTVDLIVNRGGRNTLIVCPNSVLGVWPREFRFHAGTDLEVYDFRGKGTIAKRTAEAAKQMKLAHARGKPFAVVINYEAFWRDPFIKWALSQIWDEIVFDESHRIKKPGGKWSLAAAKLARQAKRRICDTGTPLANAPLDIYGQYRALDPGVFGTSFHRFRRRYAIMGGYNDHQVIAYPMNPTMRDPRSGRTVDNPYYRPEIDREFNEKLYSIAFRVTEEVLDLPPETDVRIDVELSPKARKLYTTLTDRWIAEHAESGGVFTARNVLTRMLRQQQITGGSVNDDDGNNIEVDQSKEKALDDFLDDLPPGEPLVVFCRFVHDLDVVERMTRKHGLRYGELSGRRNDAINADAHMSDTVDVAAVQIQSGGVGIDLTRARYAMYYSLSSSLTDFLQSRKRVRRPGQTRPVTYFHLVSTGTVDEQIYAALDRKQDIVDYIMEEDGR